VFPTLHVEFRPGSGDLDTQLQGIRQGDPSVLALIAGPREGAAFLTALGREGLTMPVFGGPAMGRRLFLERAGESAEGVVFPLLWDRSAAGERSAGLAESFESRFGLEPDYAAAYTYDAVTLVIASIRQAGLNRVRIRDCLRELSPWSGVTGTITWDPTGHNHRRVGLGTVRGGRVTRNQGGVGWATRFRSRSATGGRPALSPTIVEVRLLTTHGVGGPARWAF
jgi:branched-chain amino acid transport system substrate-binding protein